MHTTTPFTPQAAAELESAVAKIEVFELARRAAEAAEIRVLADTLQLAAPEKFRPTHDSRAMGVVAPAELAYRSVRAELALATHSSEHSVERWLSHAYELTTHYEATLQHLASGLIGLSHTEVIVTAGQVIGVGSSPVTVARRAAYESAVLVHAQIETPTRLRSIARRLAAQYAERTIDEQHAEACQRRRVWVVDREDGMSDLTTYLPTVEAHAIYDRLTNMSKEIAAIEVLEPLPSCAGTTQTVQASPNTSAEQNGPETPANPAALSESPGRPRRRTRDQVRSDVFSSLLRTPTDIETSAGGWELFGRFPTVRSSGTVLRAPNGVPAKGDVSVGEDSAIETSAIEASAIEDSVIEHGRPLGAIRGQVQILVTDQTLFFGQLRLGDGDKGYCDTGDSGTSAKTSDQVETAAPTSRAPAELIGAGPIDTGTARQIAANASHWQLITQHPVSGAVMSVNRYRPTEQMRRMLGARDLHCRFPGCNAPLNRCEFDHTIAAAAGGETSTTNLAALCKGHHSLKHHGGWQVRQAAQGFMHWISPTARRYTDRPASKIRFDATPPPEQGPEGSAAPF